MSRSAINQRVLSLRRELRGPTGERLYCCSINKRGISYQKPPFDFGFFLCPIVNGELIEVSS